MLRKIIKRYNNTEINGMTDYSLTAMVLGATMKLEGDGLG